MSLSISSKLLVENRRVKDYTLTTFHLSCSQMFQGFKKEACDPFTLLSLIIGGGVGRAVELGCLESFSTLSRFSTSKLSLFAPKIASLSGVVVEGAAFAGMPMLGGKGSIAEFEIGTGHGALVIGLCRFTARYTHSNLLIGAMTQDCLVMGVDYTFEIVNLREVQEFGLTERWVHARGVAFQIQISGEICHKIPSIASREAIFCLKKEINYSSNLPHSSTDSFLSKVFAHGQLITPEKMIFSANIEEKSKERRVLQPHQKPTLLFTTGDGIREREESIFRPKDSGDLTPFFTTENKERKLSSAESFRSKVIQNLSIIGSTSSKILDSIQRDFEILKLEDPSISPAEVDRAQQRITEVLHQQMILERYGIIQNGSQSLFERNIAFIYEGEALLRKTCKVDYWYDGRKPLPIHYTAEAEVFLAELDILAQQGKTSPSKTSDDLWNFQLLDLVDKLGGVIRFAKIGQEKSLFKTDSPSEQTLLLQAVELLKKDHADLLFKQVAEIVLPYRRVFFRGKREAVELVEGTLQVVEANLFDQIKLVEEDADAIQIKSLSPEALLATLSEGRIKLIDERNGKEIPFEQFTPHHYPHITLGDMNYLGLLRNGIRVAYKTGGLVKLKIFTPRLFGALLEVVHGENAFKFLYQAGAGSRTFVSQCHAKSIAPVGYARNHPFLENIRATVHPWLFTAHDVLLHATLMSSFPRTVWEYITPLYDTVEKNWPTPRPPFIEKFLDRLADGKPVTSISSLTPRDYFQFCFGAVGQDIIEKSLTLNEFNVREQFMKDFLRILESIHLTTRTFERWHQEFVREGWAFQDFLQQHHAQAMLLSLFKL